jgi:hypothetical protein
VAAGPGLHEVEQNKASNPLEIPFVVGHENTAGFSARERDCSIRPLKDLENIPFQRLLVSGPVHTGPQLLGHDHTEMLKRRKGAMDGRADPKSLGSRHIGGAKRRNTSGAALP